MRNAARRVLAGLLVALIAGVTIMPFLYMIATALTDQFAVLRYPPPLVPARPHPENFAIALTALPFARFFLNTARDLEDAARLDGAGPWTVFWRVVLPLSKPALATLAVLAFVDQWKSFPWPLIATRSAEMSVVEVGIASFHGLYYTNAPYQMAVSVTAVVPPIVLYFAAQKYFLQGIEHTLK